MRLLTPYRLGPCELPNRVIMAPMTRSRAGEGNVPTDMNATYYTQRATAGLIITEAAQVSEQGVGYSWTPGIHTDAQVQGWTKVTKAVHENGGRVFLQLFHCGRISHPVYHGGEPPVAPSPVRPRGELFTHEGMKEFVTPRALGIEEIPGVINQFRQGAKNSVVAGFDGVEIHSANGYLPDQFLCDGTNRRSDAYGGSIENRTRFVLELVQAVVEVCGANRVGIRLSPSGIFNDIFNSDPVETFEHLIGRLNTFNLAYLHLVEPLLPIDQYPQYLDRVTPHFRRIYKETLITNGGYDRDEGNRVIEDGEADLVSYGKLFLANPDLPARFARNAPLNKPDESTFYGGDEKGYTDYPFMDG
jgi:N-ethylmaleimide reductase